MQKAFENVPEKTKLIIKSVLPLVVILILFIVAGKFGISKIIEVQAQIAESERNRTILTQKLALLKSIAQTVAEDSGAAVSALPDKNPSLIVISQLKKIGAASGVIISGIKSASPVEDTAGISHVAISFEIAGDRSQMISFVKTITNIAPITLLDKIKINEGAGTTTADVSIKSYWAIFPKSLPTLTTPITDLTPAEKKTLQDVSGLTQPDFVEIPPSEGGGKTDPFVGQ